jgi:peptide deformylase
MALRTIVTEGDEILRKRSKEVKSFGERTHMLLDDMWETMREADGVGLAAPQVGVLRRAIVIDVTAPEGQDESPDTPDDDGRGGKAPGDANPGGGNLDSGKASGGDNPGNANPDGETPGDDREKPAENPADLPVNAPGGQLYELINPELIASEGETCESEGCLSIPGVSGLVRRPERVTVKATDRAGNEILVEGKGILAKAMCHEIDHLDGVLFTDIAEETEGPEPRGENG